MIAHLFEKFELELMKVLDWLLSFANRLSSWQEMKPYEFHELGNRNIDLSPNPLIVIEVGVEQVNDIEVPLSSGLNSDTETVKNSNPQRLASGQQKF